MSYTNSFKIISYVFTAALRNAKDCVPEGSYFVDAEALKKARQNTPKGEYHR